MTRPAPWGSRERPWPISVGDLDAYAYFMGPGQDLPAVPMTDEAFIRRLNRLDTPGAPAIIGSAFHAAIEAAMIEIRATGQPISFENLTGTTKDGHTVKFFCGAPTWDKSITLHTSLAAYTVVEQDVELVFETPEGWIHMRGVVDGLRGFIIRDIKTTKKPAAEKYQDSWQWRCYLAAMGEQYTRFEYHVFQVSYGQKAETELAAGRVPTVAIVDYMPLTCHRYPELMKDLQGIAAELVSYFKLIGWEPPAKREMSIF